MIDESVNRFPGNAKKVVNWSFYHWEFEEDDFVVDFLQEMGAQTSRNSRCCVVSVVFYLGVEDRPLLKSTVVKQRMASFHNNQQLDFLEILLI